MASKRQHNATHTSPALRELRTEAGATVRAALSEAGVRTWPASEDRRAGEVVTGAAYGRIAEALEDAHLALTDDGAHDEREW